jgi:hypothetical protein
MSGQAGLAVVRALFGLAPPVIGAELHFDHLWTQREAATYVGVSQRYLRASSCPKKLLPGTGAKGRPLVRYDPAEVCRWVQYQSAHRRFA